MNENITYENDLISTEIEENEPELCINSDLGNCVVQEVKNLIVEQHFKPVRSHVPETTYQMKIVLKNDQPFSFGPRKLSFESKKQITTNFR